MKKAMVLFALSVSYNLVQAQTTPHTTTASQKASATLSAVCTIAAQNVNFGQISLPVSNQSATSTMNVECTKGSAYTISLAYGGIYGQGQAGNGDYYVFYSQVPNGATFKNIYYEYNSSGQQINYIGFLVSSTNPYGLPPDATLTSGHTETPNSIYTVQGTGYTYGELVGSAKGDTIGYSIQVPGNSSEVWNSGSYSYSTTGTGSNQSIPVVATLQPSQTSSQYPSADTYLDVVTATITY